MKTQVTDKFTQVLLEPGETVAICRCGRSDTWPICDGHHRTPGYNPRPTTPAFVSAAPARSIAEASGLPIQIIIPPIPEPET